MSLCYSNDDRKMLSQEPFRFLHFMVVTCMTGGKIQKIIKYVAATFGVFLTCVQIMAFVNIHPLPFNKILMTTIYVCITVSLICLSFIVEFENLVEVKRRICWSHDCAGPHVGKLFTTIGQKEEKMAIATFVLIITCEIHFFRWERLSKFDYTSELLLTYFPLFHPAYMSILITWCTVSGLLAITWPLTFMYFSWHLQYQVTILAQHIKEISADFETNHMLGSLFDNSHYQKVIWKRLKFIIHRHVELLSSHNDIVKYLHTNVTTLLVGISGGVIAIGSCWSLVVNNGLLESILLLLYFALTLEMLASSAQKYEDRFGEIHDAALEILWYEWDLKNRKAYLMLVQASARVVPYVFFNSRINRVFQVKMLNTIYAFGSVVIQSYL